MRHLISRFYDLAGRLLPNLYIFNVLLAGYRYRRQQGRWPRNAQADNANLNDYLFNRMVRNKWTFLERLCVDKECAKMIAAGHQGVQVPETVAIYKIRRNTSLAQVEAWLQPFAGQALVLKPTHSSGQVLFMDQKFDRAALQQMLNLAKRDYFFAYRETQYWHLPKKLILETHIRKLSEVDDWKFFCARGKILFGYINIRRFQDYKRVLFTVPGFETLNINLGHKEMPDVIPVPKFKAELIAAAESLSKPFEFVRIDLFETESGIFMGEYTFTPEAGMGEFSDETFVIGAARWIKDVNAGYSASHRTA